MFSSSITNKKGEKGMLSDIGLSEHKNSSVLLMSFNLEFTEKQAKPVPAQGRSQDYSAVNTSALSRLHKGMHKCSWIIHQIPTKTCICYAKNNAVIIHILNNTWLVREFQAITLKRTKIVHHPFSQTRLFMSHNIK